MLKKEDIKTLSELTRISVKDLTTALEAEEETPLTFEDVIIFTPDELETREIEQAKKAGKTAVEMAVKDARNKLVEEYGEDYNFTGKVQDNLYEALKKAAHEAGKKEAGTKPNETIELQKGQIEKLQNNIKKIEQDKDEEIERLKTEQSKIKTIQSIEGAVPVDLDTTLSRRDLTTLFNVDIETAIDENGKTIYKKNGEQIVDDKTQAPTQLNEIMKNWLDGKGIKQKANPRGRGGDDGQGTPGGDNDIKSIKTTDDYYNYIEKNKIPADGRKEVLLKVQKENPEFVLGE